MKKIFLFFSLGLVFCVALASCNLPGGETTIPQVDIVNTSVAQTVQAQQTNSGQSTQSTESQPEFEPTLTPTLEPTQEPTKKEQTPTATSAPTNTPTKEPTRTPEVECNVAAFISETIPDGTDFDPDEDFTKTWTLKNIGSCTWNANYDVVYVKGDAMGAPKSMQLTDETIKPGETVKITLNLEAPVTPGRHRGEYKLRDQNGNIFGIDVDGDNFWVEIDVMGTVYDFTKNYCESHVVWSNADGTLPCPGSSGENDGWVKKINNPVLENGIVDDEPGLQVHPQMVDKGWIKGTFPKITVSEGVNFYAIIGCYGSSNCDVKFRLNYKIKGSDEQTLATWREIQDGKFTRVKVNLDKLAGEEVQFILIVKTNGSPSNDMALWFGPRIEP